jgi:hypothetical protein
LALLLSFMTQSTEDAATRGRTGTVQWEPTVLYILFGFAGKMVVRDVRVRKMTYRIFLPVLVLINQPHTW